MNFNATFSNMSAFLWQSTLLGRVQDYQLKAIVLEFENTKGLIRIRNSK